MREEAAATLRRMHVDASWADISRRIKCSAVLMKLPNRGLLSAVAAGTTRAPAWLVRALGVQYVPPALRNGEERLSSRALERLRAALIIVLLLFILHYLEFDCDLGEWDVGEAFQIEWIKFRERCEIDDPPSEM